MSDDDHLNSEIKDDLRNYYDRISGVAPNLERELGDLLNALELSESLWRSRKSLECITHELYVRIYKKNPKSHNINLDQQINQLKKHIDNDRVYQAMHNVRQGGNRGTHAINEDSQHIDPREVIIVLSALSILLEWYIDDYRHSLHDVHSSITIPQTINPYKGLKSFEEMDSDRFFGRKKLIKKTLWPQFQALDQKHARFMTLLGPSGCGKSSLARAGLLPFIKKQRPDLQCLVFNPTARPLEAMSRALATWIDPDSPLPAKLTDELKARFISSEDGLRLTVDDLFERSKRPILFLIDQLEEVWTICSDDTEQDQFLNLLLKAASSSQGHFYLLTTLRSDFLGNIQRHHHFNQLISENTQIIPSLSHQELSEAISKPAELAGYPLPEAFVDLLLQQYIHQEASLPLLQFTLMEVWHGLQKNIKPTEVLSKLGGIGGALAHRTTELFDRLTPSQQQLTKDVLLKLVQINESGHHTRREVPLTQLVPAHAQDLEVRNVVNIFSSAEVRILTVCSYDGKPEVYVSITHDALIEKWSLLKQWITDYEEELRLLGELDKAVEDYHKEGLGHRGTDALWRGYKLERVKSIYEKNLQLLSKPQLAFYQESLRHQQLIKRLKFAALSALLVLLTLSLISTFWAKRQTDLLQREILRRSPYVVNTHLKSAERDQAILISMNALEQLNHKEFPDYIKIMVHRVLEEVSKIKTITVDGQSLLLPIEQGVLTVDPSKPYEIAFYDDQLVHLKDRSITLDDHQEILKIGVLHDRKTLVTVTQSLRVIMFDLTKAEPVRSSKISVAAHPTKGLRSSDIQIHPEGYILIDHPFDETNTDAPDHFTVYSLKHDTHVSGQLISRVESKSLVFTDHLYLYDHGDGSVLKQIKATENTATNNSATTYELSVTDPDRSISETEQRFMKCQEVLKAQFGLIPHHQLNKYADTPGLIGSLPLCQALKGSYLFGEFAVGGSTVSKNAEIITPSEREESHDEVDYVSIPLNNDEAVSSISLDEKRISIKLPGTHRSPTLIPRGALIAVSNHRAVHVSTHDDIFSNLDHKVPYLTTPEYLFFLNPASLIVQEKSRNRLHLHRIVDQPFRDQITHEYSHETSVSLHPQRCDWSYFVKATDLAAITLKSGDTLKVQSEEYDESDRYSLVITSGEKLISKTQLPHKPDCVVTNKDLTRVIVKFNRDQGALIYNIHDLLKDETLRSTALRVAPVSTVFPFKEGSFMITGHREYAVEELSFDHHNQAQYQTLYSGSLPIISAEPDQTQKRVLIVEAAGSRTYNSFLYALEAKKPWMQLSQESDHFLEVMFDSKNRIAFTSSKFRGKHLIDPFQTKASLYRELRRHLSGRCVVRTGQSAEDSSCWSTLED